MAQQAKLLAALKKKADDDDAPRPQLAPSEPTADMGTLKLRKSTLTGAVTWEAVLEKLDLNGKHEYETMSATLTKMLTNVCDNPTEPKYRRINSSNAAFCSRAYDCTGVPELFTLCGFKDEAGFLVLAEAADLALLRRAIDALGTQAAARGERDERKRKADAEAAARALEARAQKAREAAAPAQFDAAVAGASSQQAMMADEDEAMVEALAAHFGAHPELNAPGTPYDAFDIERQVAGPGGTVIASVAASVGTRYDDYTATMRRAEGGEWSVLNVAAA